jgi:hypothetical protein
VDADRSIAGRGCESTTSDEIILLALELETLAAADSLDSAIETQVIKAAERHAGTLAAAALLLALFSRLPAQHAASLWRHLQKTSHAELSRAMLMLHPEMAVRALGAANLRDLLSGTADQRLHEAIARALSATVVPESECCLAAMLPDSRNRLAFVLAERAGRDDLATPRWMQRLPEDARWRAEVAFGLGALLAARADLFAAVADTFSLLQEQSFRQLVHDRASSFTSSSIALLASHGYLPTEKPRNRADTPSNSSDPIPSPAFHSYRLEVEIARDLIAKSPTATASELLQFYENTCRLHSPAWRQEAQRAVVRRALALEITLPSVPSGLSRSQIATETVTVSLSRGDTSVMRLPIWGQVGLEHRFGLITRAMAAMEDGQICTTPDGLRDITGAVLELPEATRGILASRLLLAFGHAPAMSDALLEEFACIDGAWRAEILTILARIYALRGDPVRGCAFSNLSEDSSAARSRLDGLERLEHLLDDPATAPTEPALAVPAAVAALSSKDLHLGMKLCRERLPPSTNALVVAHLIARGRALDAFADAFA